MARYTTILGIALLFVGFFLLFNPFSTNSWAPESQSLDPLDTWTDFRTPQFEVKFPFKPHEATETMADSETGERRRYDMYVSEMPDGNALMVTVITLASDAKENDQALMRRIIMEMVERKKDNILQSMDNSLVAGRPAINFVIQGPVVVIRGVLLVDGQRLYLLTALSKTPMEPGAYDIFRNSFKLVK